MLLPVLPSALPMDTFFFTLFDLIFHPHYIDQFKQSLIVEIKGPFAFF